MSNLVAFPAMPLVGTDMPPALAVIVAPLGNEIIAWVRTAEGVRILERTPNWRRAVADGRAYAARRGIPFRFQALPFRGGDPNLTRERGGDVYVEPGPQGAGTWDIVHVPPSREAAVTIGSAPTLEVAEIQAKAAAENAGAAFHPSPKTQGGVD